MDWYPKAIHSHHFLISTIQAVSIYSFTATILIVNGKHVSPIHSLRLDIDFFRSVTINITPDMVLKQNIILDGGMNRYCVELSALNDYNFQFQYVMNRKLS